MTSLGVRCDVTLFPGREFPRYSPPDWSKSFIGDVMISNMSSPVEMKSLQYTDVVYLYHNLCTSSDLELLTKLTPCYEKSTDK